ncbi:MAG: transglutaminase domain-containing protein [Thermoguttaceae bacterium]|nr:transglutaminase domain-containing protein [Thermoguttaceae bacterium]
MSRIYMGSLLLATSLLFATHNGIAFGQIDFGKTGGNIESGETGKDKKNKVQDDQDVNEVGGTTLGSPITYKYKAGMVFEASQGSPCTNIIGTVPVPMDFREQKVRIIEEIVPRNAKISYRALREGGARQMVMKMRQLRPGQQIEATVLFEVVRYSQQLPENTSIYRIPKRTPREMRFYLHNSPYIEADSRKVRELVKKATQGKENDWDKVQAMFQCVRDTVKYKEEMAEKPMRGALAALRNQEGDCEDMCALFIAMCRSLEVPARLVRVPGHCYAEFYLWDDKDKGHWFPAQVAGDEAMGKISDTRIILQKGDSFHLPESPREESLYVKELFTGSVKEGGTDPKFKFIQEVNGQQ